ncbi:protein bride of sevenless-like isoform X1 [Vespa mandarinia]|uniref:protein bride of sevenless-like isoform X1 n=1 Tax=Vespa mandarinia TaxID=7446 RepID=UPI0016140B3C|nr:protein bride of sevenless-like isoform X1 [Vespa mandarinia]
MSRFSMTNILLFLSILNFDKFFLTMEERVVCGKNQTLVEIPGDAMLSVFVDLNYGTFCNLTSVKGYEEISTAIFVVKILNKLKYVPDLTLGLRIFDTCQEETMVYKQTLQAAVDIDCSENYEMGVLVPAIYNNILEPLHNFSVLPISSYSEQNLTKPLINIMVHYISTRFESIDLVLINSDFLLDYFFDAARNSGICVKNYKDIKELEENVTEALIVVIGNIDDIKRSIEKGEKVEGPRKTWIVLSLDRSHVDDLVPSGSYIVRTVSFDIDTKQGLFQSIEKFSEKSINTITHSPYLLGIGKAIIELTGLLHDLRKRNCPRENVSCVMPRFISHTRQDIKNVDIYETLQVLPKAQSIKYIVSMKDHQDSLVDVATYNIEPNKFRILPEKKIPRMPKLCLKKFANNCGQCANFQRRFDSRDLIKGTQEDGFLKTETWIPIFLTVAVSGTFACIVIIVFILYRYFVEDILDGNPTLTIVLILGNIFTLQTVLPFCMNDDQYSTREHLNSRKIFVTTLAFGLLFSVMLSRALFLAFSTGGLFTTHINGYLQGLMVFFVFGVQIAISTSYFFLSTLDSAIVVRSLIFIALLGYDIFLLAMLFVVCCFIAHIERNYREGKCFFGTVIGLVVSWAIWVTSFILMEPEIRDTVVCFGILATAYLIIIGILIPRTYYMVTNLPREIDFRARCNPAVDLISDPRTTNAFARQNRGFYDYVHPMGAGSTNNLQAPPMFPNYYGSSSPNPRSLSHCRSPDPRRIPGYNNYGFRSEMREIENSYGVPRVCVENIDPQSVQIERSNVDSAYALPKSQRKKKKKLILEEKDCIETDVYVENRLSLNRREHDESYPSRCATPKMGQTEATICEEQEDLDINRITRF